MDTKVLPATRDWIFKLLFGDERNKSMLIDMLQTFVELPQEEYELTFMDPHLKPEAEEDKLGILDVRVRTKSGKVINIEIQVDPMRHIGKRLSYYKSKLIAEQIASGDRYDAIQRLICVCITSYELFPGVAEYVNGFRFYNPRNGQCFEGIPEEIYTVEFAKVPVASDGQRIWAPSLPARTRKTSDCARKTRNSGPSWGIDPWQGSALGFPGAGYLSVQTTECRHPKSARSWIS